MFQIVTRKHAGKCREFPFLNQEMAGKVKAFHETFPVYSVTPLARLPETAKALGLGDVYVKDESKRFGLNAFKVLGGSFAIGSWLAGRLGLSPEEMTYEKLTSQEVRETLGNITFVTATDGNHGRGVAWTATELCQSSVVFLPKGSAQERLDNVTAAGGQAVLLDMNYDDAVRHATEYAHEIGGVVIQDTAWEGYEDVPTWIMQGYTTMGLEAWEQLPEKPTHIFLQAGVGSMAGAIAGLFASICGEDRPIITIVEPSGADCVFRTAEADDGKCHFVTGDLNTIMAGLACGEPCTIGWDVLKDCADHFISCPDYVAAKGMRILGNPAGEDDRVISGESGAAGFGCVAEIMGNPALAHLKERLQLDENSRVLFFSTEGDTFRDFYRDVVWEGKYPGK